jgi:glycine/D-amino acid oxidase-like deaminating enzyme
MPETYDVVIIGGAAMGSSVAYHLCADPAFRGRVLVVEKDPTYRRLDPAAVLGCREHPHLAPRHRVPAPDRRHFGSRGGQA